LLMSSEDKKSSMPYAYPLGAVAPRLSVDLRYKIFNWFRYCDKTFGSVGDPSYKDFQLIVRYLKDQSARGSAIETQMKQFYQQTPSPSVVGSGAGAGAGSGIVGDVPAAVVPNLDDSASGSGSGTGGAERQGTDFGEEDPDLDDSASGFGSGTDGAERQPTGSGGYVPPASGPGSPIEGEEGQVPGSGDVPVFTGLGAPASRSGSDAEEDRDSGEEEEEGSDLDDSVSGFGSGIEGAERQGTASGEGDSGGREEEDSDLDDSASGFGSGTGGAEGEGEEEADSGDNGNKPSVFASSPIVSPPVSTPKASLAPATLPPVATPAVTNSSQELSEPVTEAISATKSQLIPTLGGATLGSGLGLVLTTLILKNKLSALEARRAHLVANNMSTATVDKQIVRHKGAFAKILGFVGVAAAGVGGGFGYFASRRG